MNNTNRSARIIAFYLPQYHPIPENDEWWGKGFTEWRKVCTAKALYKNHDQPKIPGELGYYDLRLPETRIAQAKLAEEYGIEGFCYWHYWFSGKQLLERPFNEVLNSNSISMPFCLGWANTNWTGVWGGQPNRILIKQDCSDEKDFFNHFNYLLKAFSDERYIKVDGKPLLYIHFPSYIPNSKKMLGIWRDLAVKNGLPGLFIVGNNIEAEELKLLGYDAHSIHYPNVWQLSNEYSKNIFRRYYRRLFKRPVVIDYSKSVIDKFTKNYNYASNYHPLIIPNWDNTARIGWEGVVLENSTPENFRKHVRKVMDTLHNKPPQLKIVFLKSWNEWAEGNYIEPDLKNGRAFLQVLKEENLRQV